MWAYGQACHHPPGGRCTCGGSSPPSTPATNHPHVERPRQAVCYTPTATFRGERRQTTLHDAPRCPSAAVKRRTRTGDHLPRADAHLAADARGMPRRLVPLMCMNHVRLDNAIVKVATSSWSQWLWSRLLVSGAGSRMKGGKCRHSYAYLAHICSYMVARGGGTSR